MRTNLGIRGEKAEAIVRDCSTNPVVVDFDPTIGGQMLVSRRRFVARTGVDEIPPGMVLSVASNVEIGVETLIVDKSATVPSLFRGFLPETAIEGGVIEDV